jgi:hypothetical protein
VSSRGRRSSAGLRAAFALAVLVAIAPACSDNSYSSASVTGQLGDSRAVLDFERGISIPEGSAASAHIELISHANKTLTGAGIQSLDPSVLAVVATVGDPSGYAFLGVRSGTATVEVLVNGRQVQTVSAIVQAPASSSLPPTLDGGAASPFGSSADGGPSGTGPNGSE